MNPDQLTRQIVFLLAALGPSVGVAPASGLNVSSTTNPPDYTPAPTAGVHWVAYSNVYTYGESALSPPSNIGIDVSGGQWIFLELPENDDDSLIARKVYMTEAGAPETGPYLLVARTASTPGGPTTGTGTIDGGDDTRLYIQSPDAELTSRKLFSAVIAFPPDARDHELDLAAVPFVTIEPNKNLETHREHPELVERCSWQVDVYGVGADDSSTPPQPQMLYVEDLEPLVRAALTEAGLGLAVIPGESDELFAEPTYTTAAGRVTSRTLVVTARRIPAQEYFEAVDRVKVSGAGGTVTLSWAHPGARFDALGTVVRRGTSSGDPAPATPTDGTAIAVVGMATSATDHPGTGTWHYAFFESYDRTGNGGAANRWSAPLTAQATA